MRAVATLWPERWSSRRTWAPSSSTTCGSARARRCECMRPTPAPPAIEASPSARRCTCRGRSRWASSWRTNITRSASRRADRGWGPGARGEQPNRGGSTMKTSSSLTRRRFMRDMAVIAGTTALGGVVPRRASAQNKMVLGTWGGDYSKLLTQNVETPLLKPKGIEVVHDIAGDSQRRAKLIAEQRLPRGTTDLQALSAAGSREMFNAGVLETL